MNDQAYINVDFVTKHKPYISLWLLILRSMIEALNPRQNGLDFNLNTCAV